MPDTQQQAQQPQGLLGNLDPALGGLIGLSMLAGSFGGQQGGMGGTLAALMPLLMPQQGNAPAAPKMGTTTIKRGDEEVTFLTKDGVPVQEIGTAPRWQPPEIEGEEPPMKPEQVISQERGIASDYRKDTAVPNVLLDQYHRVADYDPKTMTGAQDRNLIVAFAKMADPTSAVMEGEAAVVQAAGRGMPWLMDWWMKAKGAALSPGQRANILEEMQRGANQAGQKQAETWLQYLNRSQGYKQFGVDPMRVLPSHPTQVKGLNYDPASVNRDAADEFITELKKAAAPLVPDAPEPPPEDPLAALDNILNSKP